MGIDFYEFMKRVDVLVVFLIILRAIITTLTSDLSAFASWTYRSFKKYRARGKDTKDNSD